MAVRSPGGVWPTARVEFRHLRVLDANLLVREFGLLVESVTLGCKAPPGIDVFAVQRRAQLMG